MESYFNNLKNLKDLNAFNFFTLNKIEKFEETKNQDIITNEEYQQIALALRDNSIWVTLDETTNKTFGNASYPSTYGELTREGMKDMLRGFETKGKTFIDLGSGLGKTPLFAVADNNFKYAVGVELSPERHQQAMKMKEKLPEKIKSRVNYFKNDLFNFDVKDYDVIFISNLCFSNDMNEKIGNKIYKEGKDKALIFSSKEIIHPNIKLIEKRYVKMTWKSDSTIFVHLLENNLV
jgi:SAM-dependent methyltransferase